MDFINFENKKILVTGASSGIGRATAMLLSQLNARVILNGRNEEELKKTLSYMDNTNNHIILPFDVNDYNNYEKYIDKCIEDGEKISGLVYSPGIYKIEPLRALNEKDIDEVFSTNFKSFLLFSSMLSKIKYSDSLNIVGISSICAHYPAEGNIIYSASKGAMESAITSMAIELSKKKGRINAVIPSYYVNTNMTKNLQEEKLMKAKDKSLLDFANANDIANAIAFLLSDRAKCITGRTMFVDSGFLGQSSC